MLIALAGCGGGSSSGGSSSGTSSAASKADANKLLNETFGANPKASSGQIDGRIDIHVKGVKRYHLPVALTMTGPFNTAADGTPEADLTMGIELRNTALGGDLILKGNEALIGLGSTGYEIPASISTPLRAPLNGSDNSLAAILDVFGISPLRWAKNPRIVGNQKLIDVDTIHGTAGIDTKKFFLDVAKLTKRLTSLRITDITNLPRVVTRQDRGALVRSVKSATGDVYTGTTDHVMREAKINMVLKPSAADRKILGGVTELTIAGDLHVTDVGSKPKVEKPVSHGSYPELQVALDVLAENARKEFK
jgi:hypothetical protein